MGAEVLGSRALMRVVGRSMQGSRSRWVLAAAEAPSVQGVVVYGCRRQRRQMCKGVVVYECRRQRPAALQQPIDFLADHLVLVEHEVATKPLPFECLLEP